MSDTELAGLPRPAPARYRRLMRPALALALAAALAGCSVSEPPASPPYRAQPELMKWPALLERDAARARRDHRLWRRPDAEGRPLAPRRTGPAPDGADGPWRLLADRDRRPADHELDRRRPEEARHRRLEHRLSRSRPDRRRLSRHLRRRRRGGGRAPRAGRAATSSTSRPLVAVGHSAGGHLALWLAARRAASRAAGEPAHPARQPAPRRRSAADRHGGQPRRPSRPRAGRDAARQRLRNRGDREAGRPADAEQPQRLRRHVGAPPRPARSPPGADQRPPGPDHPDRLCRGLCGEDARRRRQGEGADDRPDRPCRADRARDRGLGGGGRGDRGGAAADEPDARGGPRARRRRSAAVLPRPLLPSRRSHLPRRQFARRPAQGGGRPAARAGRGGMGLAS